MNQERVTVGLEMFEKDHGGVKVDDSERPTPGCLPNSVHTCMFQFPTLLHH